MTIRATQLDLHSCTILYTQHSHLYTHSLTFTFSHNIPLQVHQEDMRCQGAKEYMDVGVSILKVNETYGEYCVV